MKGAYENGVLWRVFFRWICGGEGGEREGYSVNEPTATGSKVPFFQEKISLVAA
jgi:hypothetical protein